MSHMNMTALSHTPHLPIVLSEPQKLAMWKCGWFPFLTFLCSVKHLEIPWYFLRQSRRKAYRLAPVASTHCPALRLQMCASWDWAQTSAATEEEGGRATRKWERKNIVCLAKEKTSRYIEQIFGCRANLSPILFSKRGFCLFNLDAQCLFCEENGAVANKGY